MGAQVYIQYIP